MTDYIGGSIPDALLYLTGAGSNEPFETVSATKTTPYAYYGADRLISLRLLANAVTGSPTMDVTIKAASDSAGTGATTIATFSQVTASQLTAVGNLASPPRQAGRTPASKPYVAATLTFGGTGSITMALVPDPLPIAAP